MHSTETYTAIMRPRLGLRGRMALSYVVASVTVVLLAGLIVGYSTSRSSPHSLARQVHATAADYAGRLAAQAGAGEPAIRPFPIGQTDGGTGGYGIERTADGQRLVVPAIPTSQRSEGPIAVVALEVDGNGTVVSSSFPARFPPGAALSHLVPATASSVARLSSGDGPVDGRARLPDGQVLWTLYPVWLGTGVAGAIYVQAPAPATGIVLGIAQASYLPLVVGAIVLVTAVVLGPVGAAFGLLTMHGTVRRLRRLVGASRAFAAGDFSQRVEPRGSDEVAELQRQFNAMAAQLDEAVHAQERLSAQNARLAERGRIARELHDAMSQDLFSLRMRLAALEQRHAGDPELRGQLSQLSATASDVIRQMRALLLELRPPVTDGLDLETGIHQLSQAYGSRLGIAAEARTESVTVGPAAQVALLRVAQEALANAARHSGGDRVEISLEARDGWVGLRVADNGRGFVLDAQHHGLGLRLMRERVQELGGTLEVESSPTRGTSLWARVPAAAP